MTSLRLIQATTLQLARPLMAVRCGWCKCELPSKPCAPERVGEVSDGICRKCAEKLRAER